MTVMCALADHYIQVEKTPEGAYWLYGNDQSDDNPNINGIITWANALIAFQVRRSPCYALTRRGDSG